MRLGGPYLVSVACLLTIVPACGGGARAGGSAQGLAAPSRELDRDGDRILDADDRCPNALEIYNGIDDEDGCPDDGQVQVLECDIGGEERIVFARGDDGLGPGHAPVMDALVADIVGNPAVVLVALVGHASYDEAEPDELGRRRADSVLAALVGRGVGRDRLQALSAGRRASLGPSATEVEVARDRRVEFHVLRTRAGIVGHWNGTKVVPTGDPLPAP